MKTVLVFKTSVSSGQQARQVKPVLDQLVKAGERYNFDLDDCDHILRIEAVWLQPQAVIESLARAGFACQELPD